MSGLVAYESTDEEDDEQTTQFEAARKTYQDFPAQHLLSNGATSDSKLNGHADFKQAKGEIKESTIESQILMVGPALGPALGPKDMLDDDAVSQSAERDITALLSPYSANRALIRQLTLPPIPNLDIPPSPPGSPHAGMNSKFAHFLELKKQGVHFNERLANSSALKNPNLMQKLMDFADIKEECQCASTLSKDLWCPESFPESAYKDALAKSQQNILKKREDSKARGQREAVDFIPATTSGDSSRSGTPAATGGRTVPKSAAERVMAGLDRGKSNSPSLYAGVKRKTRFES